MRQNLNAGSGLTHCGHEVLFASSGTATPEQMIEAWFNSPGHKTALTYTGSRFAGPAIVSNGSRQVAAITSTTEKGELVRHELHRDPLLPDRLGHHQ
ncbi:hypothetical protein [Micromonospora sp. b486]|uniref:hypothetical protein n=1 Tax=Micromonospora sp. b486 TaxID=3053986 RepID=UPI00259D1095|nr:hypothetical protein [Micromonospora sp. b486]MDM4778040.1 hypothetical protein [Micromonospora sp. b486]